MYNHDFRVGHLIKILNALKKLQHLEFCAKNFTVNQLVSVVKANKNLKRVQCWFFGNHQDVFAKADECEATIISGKGELIFTRNSK